MIINYETARVLTLLVGQKVLEDTAYVYVQTTEVTPQYVRRRRGHVDGEPCVPAPLWSELILAMPHSIPNRNSVLKCEKYHNCWRVYYTADTGADKELRMSHSFCGNNLAELLAQLWIQTQVADPVIYKTEPEILTDLVSYLYPGAECIEIKDTDIVCGLLNAPNYFLYDPLTELVEKVRSNFFSKIGGQ